MVSSLKMDIIYQLGTLETMRGGIFMILRSKLFD